MTLQWGATDPTNRLRRPRPIGFDMNTGLGTADERVWFGAFYVQDQWTLKRFTLSGALRYDHAAEPLRRDLHRARPVRAHSGGRQRLLVLGPGQRRQLQRHHAALGRRVGRVRHRQDLRQVEHGQVPAGRGLRRLVHRQQFGAPIEQPADPRVG